MDKLKKEQDARTNISIIVPCKNIPNYIKNLLLSFHMINLTGIKYEILFILDDENDETWVLSQSRCSVLRIYKT